MALFRLPHFAPALRSSDLEAPRCSCSMVPMLNMTFSLQGKQNQIPGEELERVLPWHPRHLQGRPDSSRPGGIASVAVAPASETWKLVAVAGRPAPGELEAKVRREAGSRAEGTIARSSIYGSHGEGWARWRLHSSLLDTAGGSTDDGGTCTLDPEHSTNPLSRVQPLPTHAQCQLQSVTRGPPPSHE